MTFDFECVTESCREILSVKSPIGKVPKTPYHCRRQMKRLYTAPRFHVQWGRGDYLERAARGEEVVPGLSTEEVRKTVDTMTSIHS